MTPVFLIVAGVLVLLLLRVPVAFAFAFGGISLCLIYKISITGCITNAFSIMTNFAILALPLFILLGTIINRSGLARQLIDFVYAVVGRARSGLGVTLVCTNTLFGAISGAAAAALSALGTIFIPQLERKGYPRGHSTAFALSASVLSLLIPPSGNSIFFGVLAQVSVVLLFAATLVPGLILTILLCIIQVILARRIPTIQAAPKISYAEQAKNIVRSGKNCFFVLLLPFLIMGVIYSGMATPTEAASVSVVYGIFISWVIYRAIDHKALWQAVLEAGKLVGILLIMFLFVFMFVRVLIIEGVPAYLLDFLLGISTNKAVILLMFNIILFITGMFMEDTIGLMLAAFIYMPAAKMAGIDPLHFASIVAVNLGMGLITPPVAPLLYLGGIIANIPLREYLTPTLYCIIFGFLPTILLVTYVPEICLALPRFIVALRG